MSIQTWPIPGGIHPPEHKELSSEAPIRELSMPKELILPVNMHIGAPSRPVVTPGESVLKGQVIAEPSGFVSAAIHAPTSGVVTAIEQRPIQHPSGLASLCIVIQPDGQDQWIAHEGCSNWHELSNEVLRQRIHDAGIVGLGGAGFPTQVKLSVKPEQKIRHLVLNAVECEPYITADDRLMREHAAEIIEGLKILAHLVQPEQVIIAIEDNKPEAIAAMRSAAVHSHFEIAVLPTKYPSGGEKQLIHAVTGKEVPSGGLPADIGVIVQNTGTAWAAFNAVVKGEPLVSRITTVTGEAIARPGNYRVLIGTPVKHLLAETGAHPAALHRIVMGGPMMGFTVQNAAVPVVKTTNCIIAATSQELPDPAPEQPCIRCGSCAQVCPAGLLPQQLYWFARAKEFDKARHFNLMDCIECGCCSYVCPSSIPLVQYYRYAKGNIRQAALDAEKSDRSRERFEARKARLEAEAAEKEARRKAREQARAQKQAAAAKPGTATPATDDPTLKALKTASSEASKAYKAAVKAAKQAQAEGAGNASALQAQAEAAKQAADAAKAAVRNYQPAATTTSSPDPALVDQLKSLKEQVSAASKAYKAAVKTAKTAEAEGADNAAELRQQADQLKAEADQAKSAMRAFQAEHPDVSLKATSPEPAARTPAREKPDTSRQLKGLKTAVNMARKQYQEAQQAFERACKDEALQDKLPELEKRVEKLKAKLENAQATLEKTVAETRQESRDEC